MARRIRVASTLLLLLPAVCRANGMFIPTQAMADAGRPSSAAQKAVIVQGSGEEVLVLRTTYAGPSAAFAWVVPVPTVPTEVFEAEPRFLDQVFLSTGPRAVTHVDDRAIPARSKSAGMEGGSEGGAAPASTVTVHQRLEVGDYDASVLTAGGAGDLVAWLREHGYAVPEEAAAALQPYTERGFAFVAVRFLTGVAEKRPTTTDVAPLGIRFATEKPFFPLHISRGSAPPLTSLLLAVFADTPVECETIPCVRLSSTPRTLARGETYGAVRRESVRAADGPRLLCEFCGRGGIRYADLSYRADDWGDASLDTGLPARVATRFFGLLKREEMEDLTFTPALEASDDYQVLIDRQGRIHGRAYTQWGKWQSAYVRTGDGLAGAESADAESEEYAGVVIPAAPPGAKTAGGTPAPWTRWVLGGGAVVLLVGSVVVLRRRGRRALPPLGLLWALGLLLALVSGVFAGGGGDGARAVDAQLTLLDRSLQAYLRDTGCYPQDLADLTATQAPTEGLDASGNTVPLTGAWRGPYLPTLPDDLLGAGLAYDIHNLRPVDSGGWTVEVSGTTEAQARRAAEAMDPFRRVREERDVESAPAPVYWTPPPAATQQNHALYSAWLRERNRRDLQVGDGGQPCVDVAQGLEPRGWSRGSVVVADPAAGEYFTLGPSTLCADPADGAAYVATVFGRGYERGGELAGGFGALLCSTREGPLLRVGRRPISAAPAAAALSPDGSLLATWNAWQSGPLLVGPRQGPLTPVARGRFLSAVFAPDRSAVYALGWRSAEAQRLLRDWYSERLWRSSRRRAGRLQVAKLLRIPLDGSGMTVVGEALGFEVLSASRDGVLVYDADGKMLLVPHDGGTAAGIAIPDDKFVVAARAFDEGIVYVLAPVAMADPRGAVDARTPWLGEAWLIDRPGGAARKVASVRVSQHAQIGIVGLDRSGAVTFAWRSSAQETVPWTVKTVRPNGASTVLENRAIPETSYGEPVWATERGLGGAAVTPSQGAAVP